MAKKYDTPQQQSAYDAGLGYGHGKAGKRVPVKDENKSAFRDGVNDARARFKAPDKPKRTREEIIKHYTDRVNNPDCTQGQRAWAAKRLADLVPKK